MKAAVLQNWNKLAVCEKSCPEPGSKEVLVQVAYTGICGSDIHSYTGKHPLAHAGMVLGHEFSGIIAALGGECTKFKIGDKVCAHIIQECGLCDACKEGHFNLCRSLKVLGTQTTGTFAEYVTVKEDKLFLLPPDANLRVYALAEPLAVGVYATNRLYFKISDKAFIIGAGPIGLCCAFAAQKAGASKVVLSETQPERIEFAKSLGFTVMDAKKPGIEETILKLTDGKGFNRIYETSGVPVSTELVTKIGAVRASVVMIAYSNDPRPIDTWNLMRKEIVITSIRVHTQQAFEAAVKMMISDALLRENLIQIITSNYDLDKIQEAFQSCLNTTNNCKVMVRIMA